MRRPLKPFVTEYKQSNRRSPAPGNEQSSLESERPPPRLFDLASNESEDSYDAAMRAADALFSIPSPRAPSSDTDATPARTQPISAARQAPNVEGTPLPAASAPEKPGGRILRVLDEPPNPQLMALEAEHAPKRRGRKPGSKNKPKTAIAPLDGQSAAAARVPIVKTPVSPSAPAGQAMARTAGVPSKAAPVAPHPAAQMPTSPAASRIEAPPKGDKKFAWVRDRLRPGEDWKRRRLPRVCW